MIQEFSVDLAPFINFAIYIIIFISIIIIYRWLLRLTYGRKIEHVCKQESFRIMAEHYKKYEFKNIEELLDQIKLCNRDLKNRFDLNFSPILIDNYLTDYTNTIPKHFNISQIRIVKKFWFYKMNIAKSKHTINYKDSLAENRGSKIDNLLD